MQYTAHAIQVETDLQNVLVAWQPEWQKRYEKLVMVPDKILADALMNAYPGEGNTELRRELLFVWNRTIKVHYHVLLFIPSKM